MLSPAGHRDIRLPPPLLTFVLPLLPSTHPSPKTGFLSRGNVRLLVNRGREEALGVVDVHGLHVAVQLLLGALLVVSLPGDSHAEPEGNALDAALPDLLVELGVDADVGGALFVRVSIFVGAKGLSVSGRGRLGSSSYHLLLGELADLLDGVGGPGLEGVAVELNRDDPSVRTPHPIIPSNIVFKTSSLPTLRDTGEKRTLLCMWMVYSRATTSAMAERCCVFFPFVVADIVKFGVRRLG